MSGPSRYFLSLPGEVVIEITSGSSFTISERDELLLGAYLPGVKVVDTPPAKVDIQINHVESTRQTLSVADDVVTIYDAWRGTFPDDLPHLLFSIARTLWIQRSYYPVHAACVGVNDFVLMPGPSGTGKSTTALAALVQHGGTILSGNTTLIRFTDDGVMQAVAGTKTMTLTKSDFHQGQYATSRSVYYGDRVAFQLSDDQISAMPQSIAKIAMVRLDDRTEDWSKLSPLSALHRLYPYFIATDYQDCIVAQGRAAYYGETTQDSRQRLLHDLSASLTDISVFTGIGRAPFLAEKVVRS